jgi:hypothetical protein
MGHGIIQLSAQRRKRLVGLAHTKITPGLEDIYLVFKLDHSSAYCSVINPSLAAEHEWMDEQELLVRPR